VKDWRARVDGWLGSARADGPSALEKFYLPVLSVLTLAVMGTFLFSTYRTPQRVTPEFMLATLRLPCDVTDIANYDELAVVITPDKDDITQIKKSLTTIRSIVPLEKNQIASASFFAYRAYDKDLQRATYSPDVWTGYTVGTPTPQYAPPIQVPLMFHKQHTMRLFGIGGGKFNAPKERENSFLTASTASTAGARAIRLLLQADFTPDEPNTSVQNAELNVTFFSENVCGDKKPGA
jgi:hypothetical protein